MSFFDDNLIGGKIMGNTIRSLLHLLKGYIHEAPETLLEGDAYHPRNTEPIVINSS